jgi:CO/xanthine dehydrogenase Mo-binding subunit
LPFFDGASAHIRINEEGPGYIFVSEPDIGQGSRTTFANLDFTAAHVLGKGINPLMAEGQVHGAIAQGFGMALYEEIIVDGGEVKNVSFQTYEVPKIHHMPEVETVFIESGDPKGPYGAKGLVEPPLTSGAHAIANAVFNAIGVYLTNLPMNLDRLKINLRLGKEINELFDLLVYF